jgi:hypothetical protein
MLAHCYPVPLLMRMPVYAPSVLGVESSKDIIQGRFTSVVICQGCLSFTGVVLLGTGKGSLASYLTP